MRKVKLLDSFDLQKFLSDYRDLMSWVRKLGSAQQQNNEIIKFY